MNQNIPVVILCGGIGTRLREETEFKPKPLVEIGGKPIIWHIMKIYSHFGYKTFFLPLGYKGEMIKEYFIHYDWRSNDFSLSLNNKEIKIQTAKTDEDWNIHFIDTGLESKTAKRLFHLKKYLEKYPTFMLTYGDGVADINIKKLLQFHFSQRRIVTITGLHPHSKYGVINISKDNIVQEFKEKPILDDFINGGFMVINREIFNYLDDRNVMLVDDTLPELTKTEEVALYHHEGFWHCMDTYRDYINLNSLWDKDPAWKIWGKKEINKIDIKVQTYKRGKSTINK